MHWKHLTSQHPLVASVAGRDFLLETCFLTTYTGIPSSHLRDFHWVFTSPVISQGLQENEDKWRYALITASVTCTPAAAAGRSPGGRGASEASLKKKKKIEGGNCGVQSQMWSACITLYNVCSVHRGVFSTSGDTMSTSWGYHEYIRGCSVHRKDIMIHVGEQVGENLSISNENPNVLNIPQCTHDIPPMYSRYPWCTHGIPPMYWTSPDVLMISPKGTHGVPWCTEHPPMYSWYPPDVLNTPDVLMISPWCIEHPPMYSWYPPNVLMISSRCTEHPSMYWTSPDVLNISRCTEHTLYRVCILDSCHPLICRRWRQKRKSNCTCVSRQQRG